MKVCLSHAHWMNAEGARRKVWAHGEIKEWPDSKKINERVAKIFASDNGVEIILIDPLSGTYVEHLNKTVQEINRINPEFAIETHYNAHKDKKANGFEVLYYSDSPAGRNLAFSLFDEMKEHVPLVPRGIVPRDNVLFLKGTKCPAVIIEAGFITNDRDYLWLWSNESKEIIAKCIVRTILNNKKEA